MKRSTAVLSRSALAATLAGFLATAVPAQAQLSADVSVGVGYGGGSLQDVTARIWFDRGHEPVVARGDRVRVYYRTDRDAYVAIFRIDTNGTTRLVYPSAPSDPHYVRGGRDYRLFLRGSSYWHVGDAPGLGYYFIVASPVPFDFSLFDYAHYGRSWDLTRVGRTVYSDPYVAMDDYVAALLPEWSEIPYGLDYTTYHVGRQRYDYPRFVCYDCHGFRSYASWNPYHYACTSFRIVIYDDPYYYPAYRYRGRKVVFVRPPVFRSPRFAFKERARGETARPLIATRATSPPVIDRRAVPRSPVARRSQPDPGRGTIVPDRRAQPRDAAPERRRVNPGSDAGGTRVPARRADPTTGGGGDDVSPTRRARPDRDGGRGIVVTPTRPDPAAGDRRARPSDRGVVRRGTPVLERNGGATGARPTRAVPETRERPSRGRPVLQPRSPARSATPTTRSNGADRAVPSRPSVRVRPGATRTPDGSASTTGRASPASGSRATTTRGRAAPSRGPSSSRGRALPSRAPTASTGRAAPSRPPTSTRGRALPSRTPARASGARARTGVGSRGSRAAPTRARARPGGASASPTSGGRATGRATPTRVRPRGGSAASAGARATGRAAPARVRARPRGGASAASGRTTPSRVKPRAAGGRSTGRPPVRVRPRTGGGG